MKSTSWDFGRFLQTLAYFDVIPVVGWLQRLISGSTPTSAIDMNHPSNPLFQPQADEKMLFNFSERSDLHASLESTWGALDDVVMGGTSVSGIHSVEAGAAFTGTVSTANSGGFASVRSRNFTPPINLLGYQGVKLRVKGDGQRYKFLMRSDDKWDSVAYSYSFDTVENQWIEVYIPFKDVIPVFRAKILPSSEPINASHICSFQLMLSKFEYDGALNPKFIPGSFCLQVQAISAYKEPSSP